jgi:TolA-binding protein
MQDAQEVATETLADIYATQGHKDKAIEIYEQLILKYPEKHIYFAAQIERLKE